jgi:type II secretory pathway pseudopilin PulG
MARKKEKGVTLVEIIIAVAITAFISSLVFVNLQGSDQSLSLDRAANKIAQDIRRAAGLALEANPTNPCFAAISGYGIHIDGNSGPQESYILYANCSPVGNEGFGNEGYGTTGLPATIDVEIEEVFLENGLEILSVTTNPNLDIAFFPPDPRITLCNNAVCGSSVSSATITIRSQADPTKTRTIDINNKGRINVN